MTTSFLFLILISSRLGVGAPLPEKAADGSWNRTELSSNDKLRKQLLGRNYDKVMKAAAANKPTPQNAGPASAKTASATPAKSEESDDEEEGRAAMVGKKRKAGPGPAHAKKTTVAGNDQISDKVDGDESVPTKEAPSKPPSKGRKKATSYLDELLAERSKKRKKR